MTSHPMPAALTLTQRELEDLTGTPRARLQMEWLQQHGLPAVLGRDGKAKVLRAAVEARMMPGKGRSPGPKSEPDFTRMKKVS